MKLSLASFLLCLVTNCWVLDPSLPLLSFSVALLPTLGVKLAELACLWNLDATQRLNSFTAYCLGLGFLLGLYLQSSFGIYLCFLAFFHFSEYVATGLGNPRNLSFDSYLVSPSNVSYSSVSLPNNFIAGESLCAIWCGNGSLVDRACTLAFPLPLIEVPLPGDHRGDHLLPCGGGGEEGCYAGGRQELQPPCTE